MDAKEVSSALGKVMYACSTKDDAIAAIKGVKLIGDGSHLNFIATDSFRLAINQIEYPEKIDVTIPKESLQKTFSIGFDGELKISVTKNNAVIKCGDYTVYTRLLEGKFVDHKRVLAGNSHVVKINRLELLESVQRSQICADNKLQVPVVFHGENDKLKITLKSSLSEFNETIIMPRIETDSQHFPTKIEIAFNGMFIVEALKSFDDDIIEMKYTTEHSPVLFCENKGLTALVVPVRRK